MVSPNDEPTDLPKSKPNSPQESIQSWTLGAIASDPYIEQRLLFWELLVRFVEREYQFS